MDHDIFRFLAKGKGREASDFPGSLLLEKADFSHFNMHEYWWYFLNSNGEGRTVHFPIRAKPVLRWSAKQYILVNGFRFLLLDSKLTKIGYNYTVRI